MKNTLIIIFLFYAVAILTHILIKWAYGWHELYTLLVIFTDAVVAAFAVALFISNKELDNE